MNDHRDACGLKRLYFIDSTGMVVGHINGIHGIVMAARS
jgi:hypothetical protein